MWGGSVKFRTPILWGIGFIIVYAVSLRESNFMTAHGAFTFGVSELMFFANLLMAFVRKAPAGAKPWGRGTTTLEWTLPSSAPFHQYNTLPRVVRPTLDETALT